MVSPWNQFLTIISLDLQDTFAATCYATNGPSCYVFVPNANGFEMYQGDPSQKSGVWASTQPISWSNGVATASLDAVMAAVDTFDYGSGSSELSLFYQDANGALNVLTAPRGSTTFTFKQITTSPTTNGAAIVHMVATAWENSSDNVSALFTLSPGPR